MLFWVAEIWIHHYRVWHGRTWFFGGAQEKSRNVGVFDIHLEYFIKRPGWIVCLGIIPHIGINLQESFESETLLNQSCADSKKRLQVPTESQLLYFAARAVPGDEQHRHMLIG